jgi:type II secretory pathway pseudopilin PulG
MKTIKKLKSSNGLTVLEILTVIVIITVLASIGISNYINSSKKRAIESSILSNIRTFQVILETYRVDWEAYPIDLAELSLEADKKKYNKIAKNPITTLSGPVSSNSPWVTEYADPEDTSFNKSLYVGKVGYQRVNEKKYYLVGYGEDGLPLQRNGKVYLVSNGE